MTCSQKAKESLEGAGSAQDRMKTGSLYGKKQGEREDVLPFLL